MIQHAVSQMIGGAQVAQTANRGGEGRVRGRIAVASGHAGTGECAFGLQHGREMPGRIGVQHGEEFGGDVRVAEVVSGPGG